MRNELISFLISKKSTPEFEKLVFITGDLGFSVVEPLRDLLGPRFINAGIAEALMVSMAAGLAAEGYKVYVYSIIPFATFRCLEQIRNDVCYHNLDVTIVGIGSGYGYGTLGPTHHATEDIAAMAALPNLTIYNPGELREAEWCFEESWKEKGPKYLRLSKGGDKKLQSRYPTQIQATWEIKPGNSVAVICTGTVLPDVYECLTTENLFADNFQLISIPVFKPFPTTEIIRIVGKKPLVCISELNPNGGLEAQIAKVIRQNKNELLASREATDHFAKTPGSAEYQRKVIGLDRASLLDFLTLLN
jgi:transketolase